MRKFLLFLALFISKISFLQVSDNFSDCDFTQSPVWQGDVTGYFINASQQLQTTATGTTQTVNLYTANTLAVNVKWNFYFQMNFDPSTSNYTRIYLVSDQSDLNGPLNGYFLQIGESGAVDSYDL